MATERLCALQQVDDLNDGMERDTIALQACLQLQGQNRSGGTERGKVLLTVQCATAKAAPHGRRGRPALMAMERPCASQLFSNLNDGTVCET
jgi:hypothetical protein